MFFFTALYLHTCAQFSGGKIAPQFVAMAVAMVVAGQVAGRWTAARGPRGPMLLGCVLAGGGMFAVDSLLSPNVDLWELSAALAVVGLGLGLALQAVTASVLAIVPGERSGMAASTVNTSRELGGVFAVAILGAVINGRLVSDLTAKLGGLGVSQELQQLVLHAVTHGGLPANASLAILANPVVAAEALTNPGILGKILDAAEASFGNALHVGLTVAAVILLAAAVISLFGSRGFPKPDDWIEAMRRTASRVAPTCRSSAARSPCPVPRTIVPRHERDEAALEEGLGRVLAETELAAIEPREVVACGARSPPPEALL